jgi:hypothetical protein
MSEIENEFKKGALASDGGAALRGGVLYAVASEVQT